MTDIKFPQGNARQKNYITRKGYEAALEKYKELVDKEIPAHLLKMRGNIHENFAAEQARRDLYIFDARVKELEPFIKAPTFIDDLEIPDDVVSIGTKVVILDLEYGEKEQYTIVGVWEANPRNELISWLSPLAQALMGKHIGEIAVLSLPNSPQVRYKILEIENPFKHHE